MSWKIPIKITEEISIKKELYKKIDQNDENEAVTLINDILIFKKKNLKKMRDKNQQNY